MTTIQPRVLLCPHCKCKMYKFELTSYTVHSSVVYSDGKTECSPPILEDERILICTNCAREFWRDDAEYNDVGEDLYDNYPQAMDIYDLQIALESDFPSRFVTFYSDLLKGGFADTNEREMHLRIKLWHLLNDKNRYSTNLLNLLFTVRFRRIWFLLKSRLHSKLVIKKRKVLFKDNLNHLIKIFEPEHDCEQLLLAEMYRECGDFKNAELQIDKIDQKDVIPAFKIIMKAIKRKKSRVIKINQN